MSAVQEVVAQPAQTGSELAQKVVAEIKKTTGEEQVKLVGLYKLLQDVYAADEKHSHEITKNQYDTHVKSKALFTTAMQVYKNEFAFSKSAIKNPEEFFSAEELADANFEKLEAVPSENPWFTFLTKIDLINAYITEADEPILKHLTHIDVVCHPDTDNFEIEFTFSPNDYFSNDKLKLEVTVDSAEEDGEPIEEIKSTEIQWKEGKDPRFEEKKTKAKTKKGKKIPGKVVKERTESFFWLFHNHSRDSQEDHSEDKDDEENDYDPLSDEGLYGQAADIVHTLSRDAYMYAIPAMFGIKVDEFTGLGDIDEEQMKGLQGQLGDPAQKPECKQQ